MPWRYIDPYIERLSRHTTIYGKYWLCFVTVFRLTVLPFAESCWSDEQKEFKCNTQEIGCNNVCFNLFAPINQVRLWSIQLLAITAPLALYSVFVFHLLDKRKEKERRQKQETEATQTSPYKFHGAEHVRHRVHGEPIPIIGCPAHEKFNKQIIMPDLLNEVREAPNAEKLIWRFYIIMVILRSVFDGLFIYLQWTIYPYHTIVPKVFACQRDPCPHTVECWPSRVREKTIFYHYMYIAAGVTALLNFAEIVYIGPRKILHAFTCVKATSEQMEPDWGTQSVFSSRPSHTSSSRKTRKHHDITSPPATIVEVESRKQTDEESSSRSASPVIQMPPRNFYNYPDRYYEHRPSLFQNRPVAQPHPANIHESLDRPADVADRADRRRRPSVYETRFDRQQANNNNQLLPGQYRQ